MSEFKSVLDSQHGGTHYKEKGIQPIEYAHANDLSFFQGNVVKYVTRYKDKKGTEDLMKAIHYLQMILEFEYEVRSSVSYSIGTEVSGDISQEQLENYVKAVVPNYTIQLQNSIEELWYPPVEDGGNPWIEYDGGGQPVDDTVLLETLHLYERDDQEWESCIARAQHWNWRLKYNSDDIVAYRVVD